MIVNVRVNIHKLTERLKYLQSRPDVPDEVYLSIAMTEQILRIEDKDKINFYTTEVEVSTNVEEANVVKTPQSLTSMVEELKKLEASYILSITPEKRARARELLTLIHAGGELTPEQKLKLAQQKIANLDELIDELDGSGYDIDDARKHLMSLKDDIDTQANAPQDPLFATLTRVRPMRGISFRAWFEDLSPNEELGMKHVLPILQKNAEGRDAYYDLYMSNDGIHLRLSDATKLRAMETDSTGTLTIDELNYSVEGVETDTHEHLVIDTEVHDDEVLITIF